MKFERENGLVHLNPAEVSALGIGSEPMTFSLDNSRLLRSIQASREDLRVASESEQLSDNDRIIVESYRCTLDGMLWQLDGGMSQATEDLCDELQSFLRSQD